MHKYDKIRYLDEYPDMKFKKNLQVTIKYDGSNGRMTCEDGRLVFGTRNQQFHNVDKFSGQFPSLYKQMMKRIADLTWEQQEELKKILSEIVIFYELCGMDNLHKLKYDWKIKYIIFDGYDKKKRKYLPFKDARVSRVIELLHLTKAKVLDLHTYDEAYDWLMKQDRLKVEGVVLKDYETKDERCKILHPKNSEIESAIFAKNRQLPNHYESKFIHVYVTKNRIEKIYMKVRVEEDKHGMKALGSTLKRMFKDLMYECLPEFIIKENLNAVDLRYIKKQFPNVARPIFMTMVQK